MITKIHSCNIKPYIGNASNNITTNTYNKYNIILNNTTNNIAMTLLSDILIFGQKLLTVISDTV